MTKGGPVSERSRSAADAIYAGSQGAQPHRKQTVNAEREASFPEALSRLAHAQEREPARPAPTSLDRPLRPRWHQGQTAIDGSGILDAGGLVDGETDQPVPLSAPAPDADESSSAQPTAHPCDDVGAPCRDVAFLAALVGNSPPPASNARGELADAAAISNIVSSSSPQAPSSVAEIDKAAASGILPDQVLRAAVVLRRETHLSSAPPPPAAVQVAAAVSAELESAGSAPEAEPLPAPSSETPTPSLPSARDRVPNTAEIDMRAARAREALSNLKPMEAPGAKSPGDGLAISAAHKEPTLPSDPPPAPVQQIARQVASPGVPSDGTPEPDTFNPFARIAPAPVKVLYIQLQPAELGTVMVRMALKNDALELHLEVSRQETARLIDSDRETLTKILQSAGYMIDGVTLNVSKSDQAVLPAGGSSLPFPPSLHSGSQSDWSQPDARLPGDRGGNSGSSNSQDSNSGDRNDKKRDADRLGGDLYV